MSGLSTNQSGNNCSTQPGSTQNEANGHGNEDIEWAKQQPNRDGRASALDDVPDDAFVKPEPHDPGEESLETEATVTPLLRKPKKTEWVCCRPGSEHTRQAWLISDPDNRGKLHMIPEWMQPHAEQAKLYLLRQAVTLKGKVPFIWAVPIPNDGMQSEQDQYATQEAATKQWVRIWWDMASKKYVKKKQRADRTDPLPTEWPDFIDTLQRAVRPVYIKDLSHKLIRDNEGDEL